jgi:hypothetical protein
VARNAGSSSLSISCPGLRQELLGFERRTSRNGRDTVDHRPGGHDDLANSLALAAHVASRRRVEGHCSTHTVPLTVLDGLHGPVAIDRTQRTARRIHD